MIGRSRFHWHLDVEIPTILSLQELRLRLHTYAESTARFQASMQVHRHGYELNLNYIVALRTWWASAEGKPWVDLHSCPFCLLLRQDGLRNRRLGLDLSRKVLTTSSLMFDILETLKSSDIQAGDPYDTNSANVSHFPVKLHPTVCPKSIWHIFSATKKIWKLSKIPIFSGVVIVRHSRFFSRVYER